MLHGTAASTTALRLGAETSAAMGSRPFLSIDHPDTFKVTVVLTLLVSMVERQA